MTAGAVEGFYAAGLAEHMHGLSGVKPVFRQLAFTRQKAQICRIDKNMLMPRHVAHRAATIRDIDGGGRVEFEAHSPAMTAAFVKHYSDPIGLPGGRALAGLVGAEAVIGRAR